LKRGEWGSDQKMDGKRGREKREMQVWKREVTK